MEFSNPTDRKSVRRFIGMINFYKRHMRDLARMARAVTALTRKDKTKEQETKFNWTTECQRAFRILKEKFVLLGKSCIVYTDQQALVSAFVVHLKSCNKQEDFWLTGIYEFRSSY